ncbi:hypothetical protein AKJ16_DCAP14302, partial [Drosera capensis]
HVETTYCVLLRGGDNAKRHYISRLRKLEYEQDGGLDVWCMSTPELQEARIVPKMQFLEIMRTTGLKFWLGTGTVMPCPVELITMQADQAATAVVPSELITLAAMATRWLALVVMVQKINSPDGKLAIGFAPGLDVVYTTTQAGLNVSNAEHQGTLVECCKARKTTFIKRNVRSCLQRHGEMFMEC